MGGEDTPVADPERIERCAERIRAGGLVAFPTETVYGLGADAFNEDAVRRVFELKGRPAGNPLIVHVDGAEMAGRVVREWTDEAQRLADVFWPGPLTLVLEKGERVPSVVTGGGATVGVRCPDHPLTLALISACGTPLVGPSANPSGRVSPTTADHVREAFEASDVLTLDGGACRAGIESTVLDLTTTPARVLRLGVIGAERIQAALGREVVVEAHSRGGDAPARSPGLLGPHYAPSAPVRLISTRDELDRMVRGLGGGVIALVIEGSGLGGRGVRTIEMPSDPGGYAARLYAALREADAGKPPMIAVQRPPSGGETPEARAIWAAVLERLTRAADA
ncbi:MAG: L-threonylcarbamoyladenylate synthase [Phycisphaerales bacterium]